MMTFARKAASHVIVWALLVGPRFVSAKDTCTDDQGNPVICNPLEVNSITGFLNELVGVITYLSIPVIVVAIIYAGFLFVTAGGDKSQLKDAKQTARYVLIGAVIILAADLITDILVNTAEGVGVDVPGSN